MGRTDAVDSERRATFLCPHYDIEETAVIVSIWHELHPSLRFDRGFISMQRYALGLSYKDDILPLLIIPDVRKGWLFANSSSARVRFLLLLLRRGGALIPFLNLYYQQVGMSTQQIGVLAALPTIAVLAAGAVLGRGRRWTAFAQDGFCRF